MAYAWVDSSRRFFFTTHASGLCGHRTLLWVLCITRKCVNWCVTYHIIYNGIAKVGQGQSHVLRIEAQYPRKVSRCISPAAHAYKDPAMWSKFRTRNDKCGHSRFAEVVLAHDRQCNVLSSSVGLGAVKRVACTLREVVFTSRRSCLLCCQPSTVLVRIRRSS